MVTKRNTTCLQVVLRYTHELSLRKEQRNFLITVNKRIKPVSRRTRAVRLIILDRQPAMPDFDILCHERQHQEQRTERRGNAIGKQARDFTVRQPPHLNVHVRLRTSLVRGSHPDSLR